MKHRLLLLGLCACILACDSANPVAPSGTVLSISANPTQISLSSGSSTITVTGFKPDGNPLNPGTQIILNTTLGVLDATLIEADGSGRASTNLRSDGQPGTATVTATPASGGGEASPTVSVLIGQTPETQPQLAVTASPSTIDLNGSATVTAIARNADGSLFGAGGEILIRTDLGTLDSSGACGGSTTSETLTTDGNSEAKTTLCAGSQTGTATITGTFGSSEEASAAVTIENQRPVLIINANPSNISTAETSTITIVARDQNDLPLGSGFRIQLLASFGSLSPPNPETGSDSIATSTFDPEGDFGTAEIQAFLGSSNTVSVDVIVRGDVAEVAFVTIPSTIQDADQDVRLVARVLDSRNEGIASVIARFSAVLADGSSVGRFALPDGTSSDGSVLTNQAGDATIDLVLLETDVEADDVITVTVTVSTEDGGSVSSAPGTITVN